MIERSPKLPLKRILKHKSKHKPKKSQNNIESRDMVDELRYQAKLYQEKINKL